jgi:hypothetical protein
MQMLGIRKTLAEIDTAIAPALDATFKDSAGYRALVTALVASYPNWTDENGTNIEQLAAIAVAALVEAGVIDHDHGVQQTTV